MKRAGSGGGRTAKAPARARVPRASGRNRLRPVALEEMARMVAHEVRNALSVMYNVATGLRRILPKDLPDGEMLLGILEEELGRLDHLTRDLVSFATPAPPVLARVRVRELLDRAVAEARARCPAGAQADVRVEVAPGAGTAAVDPDRMLEALVGLLRNGIEASNGRGSVRVRASRQGRTLRIEVADDGPGIKPEDVERVFSPFYSTKPSGMGLGLALCRQIARRHRGDLRAVIVPGASGACFRLEVPVAEGGR